MNEALASGGAATGLPSCYDRAIIGAHLGPSTILFDPTRPFTPYH
ncbi:MAG: hypothetical protein ACI9EF_000503 [Pseudohongiellaceae bacterium]|jgi:hypothetical protein